MKRILTAFAIAATLLFGVLPATVSCGKDEPQEENNKEKDDPENTDKPEDPDKPDTPDTPDSTKTTIGIACAADLVAFADSVNNGHSIDRFCENGTVVLTADIDMASVESWTPIGNPTSVSNGTTSCSYSGPSFKGVFDGKNHVIYNFKMSSKMGENSSYGLFGVLDGASVSNLQLGKEGDASSFKVSASGTADAGVLAGTVLASAVNNVSNYIPIEGEGTTASARFTTGIVGFICSTDKAASMRVTKKSI